MQALPDDRITAFRIPTPFAVGDVYCYLIRDEKLVLVDCGHLADDAWERLKHLLKRQGVAVRDIDEIWLTHGHPDHFGQAARIADHTDVRIVGHPKERTNFAGNSDRERFADFFKRHRIPEKITNTMVNQLDWLQQFQEPIEPEWVDEQDRLTSGRIAFEVHHAPGHAPGHIVLKGDNGVIFGGDVLLSHISTNALINFDPDTGKRNRSLLQYRESLSWAREQEGVILPGHGKVIEKIRETADHHLAEHEKRYRRIRQIVKDQPYSLFELAKHTFRDAMAQGGVFLVLSEVLGYLDWGIEEGTIERIEEGGQIKYHGCD